jgi:Protein of unknown function (DUF3987)/RepB DNA-primase from phage plasmid
MAGLDEFFATAFGQTSGYLCIAARKPEGKFTEYFFQYPEDVETVSEFVRTRSLVENVYFCPQLLTEKRRIKTNVEECGSIWADLDGCHPSKLFIPPSISYETSPGRYQALWTLDASADPEDAEDISRRIAYQHSDEGSDRSGWDLTQLLRIPGTRNYKYGQGTTAPKVQVVDWPDDVHTLDAFRQRYDQVSGYEYLDIPFPDYRPEKGDEILERNRHRINGAAFTLFHREPESDRSSALFRLEMYCIEAGLSLPETFQVCRDAACNKFGDHEIRLWKDVCRAQARHSDQARVATLPPGMELALVTEEERLLALAHPSFVERYVEWARQVGDAAVQYHEAGAFILLSSILAGSVKLPTRYGFISPNLWFMILADTTLTRKSTAMDLAVDLLNEVDEDYLLATDGSIEGFMQAMSARPGRTSLFLRDEFTGFVEQMNHKDYMSGFREFLTKLYDGRTQKRLLRKEEVVIRNPRLILFAGGIKSKMQRLVTHEDIESGFMPRFVFITAESDVSKVRPLGPPEEENLEGRERILTELRQIAQAHKHVEPVTFGGKVVGTQEVQVDVKMTERAWSRYNQVEQTLTQLGVDSGEELRAIMVPMYVRLATSILKAAILLASARCLDGPVVVEEFDIIRAAAYGDTWRRYAQDIIINVGKGPLEHKIELVLRAVQKKNNFPRSRLMQTYHLTAREMSDIEKTLVDRGLISIGGGGRAVVYNDLTKERQKDDD